MADQPAPQRFDIDTEEKLTAWTGDIATWNAWGAKHGGEYFAALDPERPVHPILRGEAAMALWRAGRQKWNAWVEANPKADVDFSGERFEPSTKNRAGDPQTDFARFRFPNGRISFLESTFGRGPVNFSSARFGEGGVDFFRVTFIGGDVDFSHATFGEGDVRFINASFGKGDLNFFGANFGKGDADFYAANFGEGDVNFYGANFEEGNVDFFDANFEEGNVDFDNANLGKGNLDFRFASFGHSKISFVNCACDGMAQFTDLEELEDCTQFSFEGCSFAKLFTFSYDGRMGGPLDLRRTSLSHDVVVNDVKCDFGMERRPSWKAILHAYWTGMPHGAEPYSPWLNRAEDEEDSQRFRKLKELAVANRNHAKALEFHAQEIRAQRGHGTKWWQDLAQFVYWGLSDYGRSVLRPMAALIAAWLSFAAIYFAITKNAAASFGTALTYSGSHMLSFIPTGRTARSQGEAILFGDGENVFVPDWVLGIGAVESVLSVVLLFLFGLGLRNMFRV